MKIIDIVNKKYFLIFSLILILFSFFIVTNGEESEEAVNCSYAGKINQCMNSQDNVRTISNFVCINGSLEQVAFQVVLDEKFKEVDKKIEKYLYSLEKAKANYFGPEKKEEYIKAANDIEKYLGPGGEFEKQYKKLCDGEILAETIECFKEKKVSNVGASSFLNNFNSNDKCRLLYKLSLNNYRATAYAILKENKFQIQHDEHKKFTQKNRKNMDELLDYMIENRGYLDDISSDVQSTTKHPHK